MPDIMITSIEVKRDSTVQIRCYVCDLDRWCQHQYYLYIPKLVKYLEANFAVAAELKDAMLFAICSYPQADYFNFSAEIKPDGLPPYDSQILL